MKPSPTKQSIAKRLKRLSATMKNLAVDMDYYGGFAHWVVHAEELLEAAYIVDEWALEIKKETDAKLKPEREPHEN